MKIKIKKALLVSSILGIGITLTASAVSIPSLLNYVLVKNVTHKAYETIVKYNGLDYFLEREGVKNEDEYFKYYLVNYYVSLHYSTTYYPDYNAVLLKNLISVYDKEATSSGFINDWAPTIDPFVTFMVLLVVCIGTLITTLSLKKKLDKELNISIHNEPTDK